MATAKTISVPLESGDRLTREEFHARYCARPDIRKAELIDGVAYVTSPTRFIQHGEPLGAMVGWLFAYTARHPGVRLADGATVYLGPATEVQPDAALLRDPAVGGQTRVTADGYIEGAPELVVEIAASSAAYDLYDKKEAYRQAGTREYIVRLVLEERIVWFRLRDGGFVEVQPDERGVIESEVFPGLRLNVPKMLVRDNGAVLAELEAQPDGPGV